MGILILLTAIAAAVHSVLGLGHLRRGFYAFAYFDLGIAGVFAVLFAMLRFPLSIHQLLPAGIGISLWFLGGILLGFWRIWKGPDPRLNTPS